ncbi:MAG TPA: histidine--tRNA ligase [Candidatus Paceibacterota bacterium]|nr:histidine--tRNA ligase [Candidatus Paceibacterota bacterium]
MKDKLSTESYKGVRDFYPEDQQFLNYLLDTYRTVATRFGYVEYHASVLEPAELYKSKGADNEELINEQTYTFVDRGGREVTLRPEMTPTVARMVAARRRDLGFPLRLFSIPNVFRYERPQRGRLREHWQLNVDIFGSDSFAADAEIIQVAHEVMKHFGAQASDFEIKLGSRAFINALCTELELSEEATAQLVGLLDRKNKISREEFEAGLAELGVPKEKLSGDAVPDDVAEVLKILESQGISNAVFDPSIVRGFAYYTGVVFEVFDTHKDNNRALFGGGRYDNLTALFDNESITGVGFGMGDVTMRDFLEVRGLLPAYVSSTKVYIAVADTSCMPFAMQIADEMRFPHELDTPSVNVAIDFGEKKLADQIKQAAKHRIPYLIVVGEKERDLGTVVVRNLETGEEEAVDVVVAASYFSKR